MESQSDLEQKIAQYTVQLGQVDELLQLDPSNTQFLQLKTDLQNVISLTKALLMQVIGGAIPTAATSNTSSITVGSSSSQSMPVVRKGAIQVGEVVEVSGGDRLFAGVVTSIINDTEYKIKYFEYPDEVSLPVTSLSRIPFTFYSKEQVVVGMSCQCKYALDQQYYDCKVTSITENGCVVTYTAYGNSEEVPVAYLKPTSTAVSGTAKPVLGGGKNSMKPSNGGLIPIPESLTILPTDTEKEIEKKRKELKSIKNKNRIISQETEMVAAQQSWKKFVTKGAKRVDSGIVKDSQFSSPAEVDGKVGVVNSGKKMTDFVPRMAKSVWDLCYLDSDALTAIEQIQPVGHLGQPDSSAAANRSKATAVGDDEDKDSKASSVENSNNIYNLQESIVSAEQACRESLALVDGLLNVLNEVEVDYEDVTGRTNSLMMNCENLLEQQHTYQQTVEILKHTLEPFNDIESVASLLGIPFDPNSHSVANNNSNSQDHISSLSQAYASSSSPAGSLDPRSPEFKDILNRLAKAAIYLKTHHDIMDSERYEIWLEKLENRASSLVGRSMREIIEKASKQCLEIYEQKRYQAGNNKFIFEDGPIESAPLYQKFRGLSYRLRELSALVLRGAFAEALALSQHTSNNNSGGGGHNKHSHHQGGKGGKKHRFALQTINTHFQEQELEIPVINEVKQGYVVMRNELLLPFIKDAWLSSLTTSAHAANASAASNLPTTPGSGIDLIKVLEEAKGVKVGNNSSNSTGTSNSTSKAASAHISLCTGIRQAFSMLLRVTQLELQLFESLFLLPAQQGQQADHSGNSTPATAAAAGPIPALGESKSPRGAMGSGVVSPHWNNGNIGSTVVGAAESSEVNSIVETIANSTRDFLRPFIIREHSVDELCRVVAALSEDVRSQMLAMPVPASLLKLLLSGLDGTVNDAKERLSYCAEMKIRQEVQMFEPLPSHLAYPDILEEYVATSAGGGGEGRSSTPSPMTSSGGGGGGDVYQTWYPPMRNALSLLSKLYGVVELSVFEDFARRAIDLCVQALKKGSEGVKRGHPGLHGDLFLVRHLLMLREQLTPFELRMQSTEKMLDFTTTGEALQSLLANARSMWRFDNDNAFLQLARSGLPRMQEMQVDAKRELDNVLKAACFSLKVSAVKSLLGGMDAFLIKVHAFVGDIPVNAEGTPADPSAAAKQDSSGAAQTLAQDSAIQLPAAMSAKLKGQSFVRPERIQEVLEGVQNVLMQRVPDLKAVMKLYIENGVARTILLKPILQDFEVSVRKMECIINSCLDAGQARRDVEHLLQTISMTVLNDLAR